MAEVFLMEDEPNICLVLESVLTHEGHNVTTANNGAAGLEKLSKSQKPDVVLLDLNMPVLNGREVAQRMKNDPDLNDIPVVIMSGCVAYAEDFPPNDCYESVLSKPFDLTDLIDLIENLTSKEVFTRSPVPHVDNLCFNSKVQLLKKRL